MRLTRLDYLVPKESSFTSLILRLSRMVAERARNEKAPGGGANRRGRLLDVSVLRAGFDPALSPNGPGVDTPALRHTA